MTPTEAVSSPSETPSGHPRGLFLLFGTEMAERFSYYGMRAIFVLYMTKALLIDKGTASSIYGSYTGLVYLTPLIGGFVADRFWGNRRSIIFGGAVMALGQFLMFMSGTFYKDQSVASVFMYVGLGALIIGNGFFKPNISTMVGQLYPTADKRVDSAFTIFYMGINLGAFFAPLVCGFVGDTGKAEDFRWGFLAACIGMLLSLVVFITLKDKFIVTPTGEAIGAKPNTARSAAAGAPAASTFSPKLAAIWGVVFVAVFALLKFVADVDLIGSFIFAATLAAPGYIISDPSLTKVERARIWVIYVAAFFVIFFWAAFEQAGASLTYFAEEQTDRVLFGWTVPASYFQSINAVAVVLLAPLFVALWGALGKRNKEPPSPYKQAIGLAMLCIGYLIIAFGVKGLQPGTKVSMLWLISLYTIHTVGELCLSPIGLSMVNKLAPVKFASLLMGVWFLSNAAANKAAGTLSGYYPEPVVAVATVEQLETQQNVKLFPENYEKGKQKVGEVAVIPMELIQLGNIKDEAQKVDAKKTVETSLVANPRSFMGFQIANLYDFFMLFVFMSGGAAIILFALCKMLLKMMHGVR